MWQDACAGQRSPGRRHAGGAGWGLRPVREPGRVRGRAPEPCRVRRLWHTRDPRRRRSPHRPRLTRARRGALEAGAVQAFTARSGWGWDSAPRPCAAAPAAAVPLARLHRYSIVHTHSLSLHPLCTTHEIPQLSLSAPRASHQGAAAPARPSAARLERQAGQVHKGEGLAELYHRLLQHPYHAPPQHPLHLRKCHRVRIPAERRQHARSRWGAHHILGCLNHDPNHPPLQRHAGPRAPVSQRAPPGPWTFEPLTLTGGQRGARRGGGQGAGGGAPHRASEREDAAHALAREAAQARNNCRARRDRKSRPEGAQAPGWVTGAGRGTHSLRRRWR